MNSSSFEIPNTIYSYIRFICGNSDSNLHCDLLIYYLQIYGDFVFWFTNLLIILNLLYFAINYNLTAWSSNRLFLIYLLINIALALFHLLKNVWFNLLLSSISYPCPCMMDFLFLLRLSFMEKGFCVDFRYMCSFSVQWCVSFYPRWHF